MMAGVAIEKDVDVHLYNTCLAEPTAVAAKAFYTFEGRREAGKVKVCIAHSETVGERDGVHADWFGFEQLTMPGGCEKPIQISACHACGTLPVAVAS